MTDPSNLPVSALKEERLRWYAALSGGEVGDMARELLELRAASASIAGEVPLHPATEELVARFAKALRDKLATAEAKYGYSDGWASADWLDECRMKLREHLEKGDPRDVAAYCAFLWHHNATTALPTTVSSQVVNELVWAAERGRDVLRRLLKRENMVTVKSSATAVSHELNAALTAARKMGYGGG